MHSMHSGNPGPPLIRAMALGLCLSLSVIAAHAAAPPCNPCAGIAVGSVGEWLDPLGAEPRLTDEARLYVAWPTAPLGGNAAAASEQVAARGGVPWLRVRFTTPAPLAANPELLESELEGLSDLARRSDPKTHFQIEWPGTADSLEEYAFLLKRAAVALTGVRVDARVITHPLPATIESIDGLYAQEIAAYVDGIALQPASSISLASATARLTELDPGKPIVVMDVAAANPTTRAIVQAARNAADGVAVTFFAADVPGAETLAPLKVLAREFQGEDLAYDPYSAPPRAEAWSFVRGEDLALLVIVDRTDVGDRIEFADTTLRTPTQVDASTGEAHELFGLGRTANGLSIPLDGDDEVAILRLSRPDLAELVGEGGLAEEVTITTERTMPVAEILRRLQANEDAQARALDHYEAINTTHLRFQGSGVERIETTFEGALFFEQGQPYDWVWETFFVNGVKWRGKRIPEIPLLEPDKAATLPLAINFDRDYSYRLRGTDVVDGRDCWVVDFKPTGSVEEGNRYQGTVWVDRSHFLRVRSRALQLGLTGDVLSNEETLFYTPLDSNGAATEWESATFTLPLRVLSQQLFSVLNASINVEKETLLGDPRINAEDFDDRRQAAYASETTIVRDTEEGLRYLIEDEESGDRVVQDEFDKDRLFLVGGTFYDESLDFPLPLAGINYFSFDFRGTGTQANLFFAGVLAIGSLSDPDFLGSRWDAGASLLGFAIPFTNTLYRNGVEANDEDVDIQFADIEFNLGRPIGNFTKLSLEYEVSWRKYSRADDTAEEFVLPQDHLLHQLALTGQYSRRGYRFRVSGSYNKRSDWELWGLPDEPFDPDTDTYTLWQASMAKTFSLSGFKKLGIQFEYLGGDNLDRFSKYGFGYFADSRVHGYQSGLVRAEEFFGFHGTYGFEIGELFRLDLVADAVSATDEASGLKDELLAGLGIAGTFIGPWQTVVNLDFGVPVAGPDDDGFTLFLAFLKLFR